MEFFLKRKKDMIYTDLIVTLIFFFFCPPSLLKHLAASLEKEQNF